MLGAPKPPINALKIEVTVEPPQTGKRAQVHKWEICPHCSEGKKKSIDADPKMTLVLELSKTLKSL